MSNFVSCQNGHLQNGLLFRITNIYKLENRFISISYLGTISQDIRQRSKKTFFFQREEAS